MGDEGRRLFIDMNTDLCKAHVSMADIQKQNKKIQETKLQTGKAKPWRPHHRHVQSGPDWINMGCASAKHVSTVQNEEDTQNGKNYQNGDAFSDEYRFKPVEEVKYMKNGEEEEQKIVTRNQENLEKSATHNIHPKNNNEAQGAGYPHRINIHISESQQEFFRMLDEKIEKGRDYCSEEEDIT